MIMLTPDLIIRNRFFLELSLNLIYANPQKIPILDKFQRVVFALN